MSQHPETVRIKSNNPSHTDGYIVINKADFDPETQELHADDAAMAEAMKAAEALTAAPTKKARK